MSPKDSKGRYFREFHYKTDAIEFEIEIQRPGTMSTYLTKKGVEPV